MEGTEILAYMLGKKSGGGTGCRINITTLAEAEVVATQDEVSILGNADENGLCTIVVPNNGEWSITASLDGEEIQTKGINVTVDYSVELIGLDIVPFGTGTDEQIVALINAAHNGDIDLQADAGWKVGDTRTISLGAWIGGGNTSHAALQTDIVISSFEEYESCGNVMQFDFLRTVGGQRMSSNNSFSGGYAATEMYSTSLPAMYNALPTYLKDLMITFSVKGSDGNSVLKTIPNNKLALRSETEVFGFKDDAQVSEGIQIELYKTSSYRVKKYPDSDSVREWRLRSPSTNYASTWCMVSSGGGTDRCGGDYNVGLSPFGCL